MKNLLTPRTIFLCVLILGLVARFVLCSLPTDLLTGPTLFDDSFIGLKMSRNMAEGKWISWDGETKTNAVTNPLFLALMAPVFILFAGRWDFSLHVILGLSSIADGITIWLIYSFVSFLAGRRAGLFASILWAFNPYVISFNLSGSEHAFESLGFVASIYFYVRTIKLADQKPLSRYFILGILLGVTTMFRVSLLFLFAFIFIDILIAAITSGKKSSATLATLLLLTTGFTIIISPWLIYSFAEFGTIIPHNAALISYYNHNYLKPPGGALSSLKTHARIALEAFNCWAELLGVGHTPLSCPYPAHIAGPFSYADCIMLYRSFVMFAVGLLLFNAVKALLPQDSRFKRLLALRFTIPTVFFLTIYYSVFQWKLDKRYFIEVVILFSVTFPILSVLLLDAIWRSRGFIKTARFTLVLIICACLLNYSAMGMSVWLNGPEAFGTYSLNHRSMLKGALWVNRNIPSDAIIGAFNPGIYGYYMKNKVVDIVGIANKAAWDAARKGELLDYIWQKKVDYILDFAIDIDRFYTPYLTHGDQSFLKYIVEGPLFADKDYFAPIHLYIVKKPDGKWDGIPLSELKQRAAKDTF